MSIGIIVEFNIKSEGANLWIKTMKERIPETRKWAGCDYVYLQVDRDNPNHMYLVERWDSIEHYQQYRESMMSQPGIEEMSKYLIGKMKTIYLDDINLD